MTENPKHNCPTILVEDKPSRKDIFAGGHTRVAKAIADTILEGGDAGGKMIALEGGWGSGKTTVIELIDEIFQDRGHILIHTFDAWAHEGDPLRRTFLESIISRLQKEKWVRRGYWKSEKGKLSKREKTTKTTTTQSVTLFGRLIALVTLAIPFGIAIVTSALGGGAELFCLDCQFNAQFAFGIVLSFAPIAFAAIWVLGKGLRLWGSKNSEGGRIALFAAFRIALKLEFLEGESKSTSTQDTSETPEPTSIEFEVTFLALMEEALDNNNSDRQIVIVLDNLDRVDEEDARKIWSTLQTFLHDSNNQKNPWIIVPYDPEGIERLWHKKDPINAEGQLKKDKDDPHSEISVTAKSFLDKSFNLRFEVPPLVLTDWENYFSDLCQRAFPDHNPSEFSDAYNIINILIEEGVAPTPRSVNIWVNQIGTIHRQWGDDFPLSHIACYVWLRRNTHDIPKVLRARTSLVQTMLAAETFPLLKNLACMAYNAEEKLAMQLLLSPEIKTNLLKGQHDKLKKMTEDYELGFWGVLQSIVLNNLTGYQPKELVAIVSCLYKSNIMGSAPQSYSKTIRTKINRNFKTKRDWPNIDIELAQGFVDCCKFVEDDTAINILKGINSVLPNVDITSNDNQLPEATIDSLILLVDELSDAGKINLFASPFVLPGDPASWAAVCDKISEMKSEKQLKFKPTFAIEKMANYFADAVANDEYDENSIDIIETSYLCIEKGNWGALGDAFVNKLRDPNCDLDLVASIIEGMEFLKGIAHDTGPYFAALAEEGHLLHYLNRAYDASETDVQVYLMARFLQASPSLSVAAQDNEASTGLAKLNDTLSTGNPELAINFVDFLREERNLQLIYAIQDEIGKRKFLDECIVLVAMSSQPEELFTPEVFLARWKEIAAVLNEDSKQGFSPLIKSLSKRVRIENSIMELKDGFKTKNAWLYSVVYSNLSPSKSKFKKWCRTGLKSVVSDDWYSALEKSSWLLLLGKQSNESSALSLGIPFQDAMLKFAEGVFAGAVEVKKWGMDNKEDVFSLLLKSHRTAQKGKLLDMVLDHANRLSNSTDESFGAFIDFFGDEISTSPNLMRRASIIAAWFEELISNNSQRGFSWIRKVLGQKPKIFSKIAEDENITILKARVEENLQNEELAEIEGREDLLEIGKLLGITVGGKRMLGD